MQNPGVQKYLCQITLEIKQVGEGVAWVTIGIGELGLGLGFVGVGVMQHHKSRWVGGIFRRGLGKGNLDDFVT